MLDINVTIEGDQVVIEGLENFSEAITAKAVPRGLKTIAKGTMVEALANLTGPKIGLRTITAKKSGRQRTVPKRAGLHGGYPVPRLTGHLRRLQGWLAPGKTKSAEGITFSTGPLEALVYNSALYASIIHEGRGSSGKYGKRPYIDDAFKIFNADNRAAREIDTEIQKEAKARGL